jgi:hypothetical protein
MVISFFVFLQSFNVQAQNQQPTIKIEPMQTLKLDVDETFTINVTVENCVNVYAVQVDIRYDPYVLDALSVVEGPFLPSAGSTIVALNETNVFLEAEPPYGQVYYVASLTGWDVLGASGSGVLCTVTFKVLSTGSSHLRFKEYPGGGSGVGTLFMERDWTEIPVTLENGFYGTPISFSASPSKVNVGENVTLSGNVSGVNASLDVTIEWRKQGGSWTTLSTILTDEIGVFSYAWTASEPGVFEFKVSTVLEGVYVESEVETVKVESTFDPTMYLFIGVVVVVVVIVAIAFFMRRRGKKPEEVPS